MLNYGPIIVTLSTSKYSLVEIRGVFYKSAYRGNFILSNTINFCVLSTIIWFVDRKPVLEIVLMAFIHLVVPHKSVNSDSWDYAVFYNPNHYSFDISSQIVSVPYRLNRKYKLRKLITSPIALFFWCETSWTLSPVLRTRSAGTDERHRIVIKMPELYCLWWYSAVMF